MLQPAPASTDLVALPRKRHIFLMGQAANISRFCKASNTSMISTDKTIFSFWEPREKLTPYLELCRKTWQVNLPGYEIVTLDYSNIHDFIDKDVYDLSTLMKLTLPMQKDAIMVAVLNVHGGLFMDIDTLVLKDITPILGKLDHSEVIMFNTHIAFIASRANSLILSLWLNGIQKKLLSLQKMDKTDEIPWDYVGNSVLTDVLEEMIKTISIERFLQNQFFQKAYQSVIRIFRWEQKQNSWFLAVLKKFRISFHAKRRTFYFRTMLKKYLNMLDRDKYGFVLEARQYRTKRMTAAEKYIKFWFEDNLSIEEILHPPPIIIGLHNSWTPEWYKELPKQDILKKDCPLSKILKHILNDSLIQEKLK